MTLLTHRPSDPVQRPPESETQPAEALFKEARRRKRRRRLRFGAAALLVLSVGVALSLWFRDAPSKPATPQGRGAPVPPHGAKPAQAAVRPVQPGPLALGSNGDLYLADGSLDEILARTPSGTFRVIAGNGKVGFSGDGGPAVDAELDDPQGIIADPNGTIYFADSGNNRVRSISPTGTITTVAGNGGAPITPEIGASAPDSAIGPTYALASGPDGSLFIAASDAVLELAPGGSLVAVTDAQSFQGFDPSFPVDNQCDPASLATDGTGDLYIGCTDPYALVERTPNGTMRFVAMVRPHDTNAALATAPGGGVFAVDGASIVRYGQTGQQPVTDFLSYRLPGGTDFWPQGIAVGPDGSLYLDQDGVSGIGPPAIVKYSPEGVSSVLWGRADDPKPAAGVARPGGSTGTG